VQRLIVGTSVPKCGNVIKQLKHNVGMKYTEEEFKKEVKTIYGDSLEVIGRFKGISKPIMVKDNYGILEISIAKLILQYKPSILKAINKTEYFMSTLKEKFPLIYENLKPLSEYKTAKETMLFQDKFGIVSISPDSLLSGHCPNIRSAVDRKIYFYNMLKDIYKDDYDFIITNTDRKNGRSIIICPIHGEVDIDNEYIFQGKGCPKCITQTESNIFYLIQLSSEIDTFYKLGISYELENGNIRRFRDYELLGYKVVELKRIKFDISRDCKNLELKLKRLIKNNLYLPITWPHNSSTECFKEDFLDIILENI